METFTDTFEVTIRIQALCIHTIQKESQLKLYLEEITHSTINKWKWRVRQNEKFLATFLQGLQHMAYIILVPNHPIQKSDELKTIELILKSDESKPANNSETEVVTICCIN
jgi:hypothetical protein